MIISQCERCGNSLYSCWACSTTICEECAIICEECSNTVCKECVDESGTCRSCLQQKEEESDE